MDIWQIVSMVLPFSFVILQTMIDSLSRKAKPLYVNVKPINKVGAETEKQLQRNEDKLKFLKALTNCGIPLCYGLFVVCFFIYGIWCQYGAHWVKFSFIKCTTFVNVNKLFSTHNTILLICMRVVQYVMFPQLVIAISPPKYYWSIWLIQYVNSFYLQTYAVHT